MILLSFIVLFIGPGLCPNQIVNRQLLACFTLLLCAGKLKMKLEAHHWLFLAWVIWAGIGCWLSPWPEMAFYGNQPNRGQGFLTLLITVAIAFSYWHRFNTLYPLAITGAVICMIYPALYIWLTPSGAPTEFKLHEKNLLSMICLPPVAMGGVSCVSAVMASIVSPLGSFFSFPALVFTRCRSGFIGLLTGFWIYTWFTYPKARKSLSWGIVGVATVCLAAFLILPGRLGTGPRPYWINEGAKIAQSIPLWGFGLDTQSNYLTLPTGPDPAEHMDWKDVQGNHGMDFITPDRCHNIIFDTILTTGWVGYALLLLVFGCAMGFTVKNPTGHNVTCLSVVISWIAFSMFNPSDQLTQAITLTAFAGITNKK